MQDGIAYQSSNLSLNITLLSLSAKVFYSYAELSHLVLRAHLINNCNAPVEWLQDVFTWPKDSLLRKSWRAIARCRMGERRMGNNLLRNGRAGIPPG